MYDNSEAAEAIRKALDAPIEEREKLELPKPKPVDELQRARWKPVPTHSKKKVVPR